MKQKNIKPGKAFGIRVGDFVEDSIEKSIVNGKEAPVLSGEPEETAGFESETSAQEASAAVRQTTASYVIKEGDTLADVCEMYYGSLDMIERICEENGIEDPNQILPGQKIVLP